MSEALTMLQLSGIWTPSKGFAGIADLSPEDVAAAKQVLEAFQSLPNSAFVTAFSIGDVSWTFDPVKGGSIAPEAPRLTPTPPSTRKPSDERDPATPA